jgi:hypothetical protein
MGESIMQEDVEAKPLPPSFSCPNLGGFMNPKQTTNEGSPLSQAAESLKDSIAKLQERTRALGSFTPTSLPAFPESHPAAQTAGDDEATDAAAFYEQLRQTGQITNVDETTNLEHVSTTHIQKPDGTIERVQFQVVPGFKSSDKKTD